MRSGVEGSAFPPKPRRARLMDRSHPLPQAPLSSRPEDCVVCGPEWRDLLFPLSPGEKALTQRRFGLSLATQGHEESLLRFFAQLV
jgi:hypothetical protein